MSSTSFLNITDGKAKYVVCKLSEGYESVVAKTRHILKCIIETIIPCVNQGLALKARSQHRRWDFFSLVPLESSLRNTQGD